MGGDGLVTKEGVVCHRFGPFRGLVTKVVTERGWFCYHTGISTAAWNIDM